MEGFAKLLRSCFNIKKKNNLSNEKIVELLDKIKRHYDSQ